MLGNYLKVIIRNLWRFRGYSFVNLFGLALGISVCLQVFLFVYYERRFDADYPDNIYRVYTLKQEQGTSQPEKVAKSLFPLGPNLQKEMPGIQAFTRIIMWEKLPLQKRDGAAVMSTSFGVDSNFLQFFGFRLLSGNAATALQEPGSIVLTQHLARALFGDHNPMGQVLHQESKDTTDFTVRGIMPDVPVQSHLQFDALYSAATVVRPAWNNNWEQSWMFNYIRLDGHANVHSLEERSPTFLQRHGAVPKSRVIRLLLQPLKDIHLYSGDIRNDGINSQKFNGAYLPFLVAVALFVLALAIINYINLNTARLLTRAKEVGVRKTNGASSREIGLQFFIETLAFSLLSFLLAMLITALGLPFSTALTGRELSFVQLPLPVWLIASVALILGIGLTAGVIPALAMARIQPISILKGNQYTGHRSPLRNVLVVLQFTISITLTLASVVAIRQLRFIRQHDPGFNKEGVVSMTVSYANRRTEEGLMQALRQVPGVTGVTGALRRIGGSVDQNPIVFTGDRGNYKARCTNMYVDFNYVSFYQIPLLAGRNFSSEYATDRNGQSYIINESLARKLLPYVSTTDSNLATIVGKQFRYTYEDSMGTIVGIVRDFNFGSLHQRIEPLVLSYQYEYFFIDLSIRIDLRRQQQVLAQVERCWKSYLPLQQFNWHSLDDSLQQLYRSDRQTGLFIVVFAAIAFIVSVLGLTGVAAFSIERRTKEIGVRKVLGATIPDILLLLSKEFLRLVSLSIGIALPIAWWAAHAWITGFAYHATLDWWLFGLVAVLALLTAALTVNLQAVTAARANPVKSLRSE